MRQNYTGSLYSCGGDIQVLIDNGIKVMAEIGRRWKELKAEAELNAPAIEYGTENIIISYRIPPYKYEFIEARLKEADEALHEKLQKEHEAWLEERQRKIDAYLKKYPWRGEPECWKEGIDFERVNDPEKGEIIVKTR